MAYNFDFIIKSYEPEDLRPGSLDFTHNPWVIEQKATKNRFSTLNGQLFEEGRIVVRGKTSDKLSPAVHRKFGENWAVCLDWDGEGTLTEFPDSEYVKHCKKEITV